MRTIWEYEMAPVECQTVAMPKGAAILCVQMQDGVPCLWAEVDSEAEPEERKIHMFGTGWDMGQRKTESGIGRYIGTVQMSVLVFHFFSEDPVK